MTAMVTIHTSPLPDVEIPEVPLTEYVLSHAAAVPDRTAGALVLADRELSVAARAHAQLEHEHLGAVGRGLAGRNFC